MRFRVLNGAVGKRAPWHGTVALCADEEAPASQQHATAGSPWLLMNLSGPVASRLESDPALAGVMRRPGPDGQPILLTDAQLDQVAGLINLRGGAPIDLYATPSVFEDLTSTMPVLPELERHCGVHWHIVPVAGDRRSADFHVRGQEGLEFMAFDAGPAPDGCVGHPVSPSPGRCIAVGVRDRRTGRRAVFARGLGAMALSLLGALEGADCLLVDPGQAVHPAGTTGVAGSNGPANTDLLVDWMSALPLPRKVLLGTGDGVRGAALLRRGIEVGIDGVDIVV